MTWIWATLLLILSAPFVLWPLIRAAPPDDDDDAVGAPTGPKTPE